MDFKHLRTFVTVAEHGTVTIAAEKLRVTQPALSRQLQDLQAELGVTLFEQVGRRLRLTAEGAELLPECRALLDQTRALVERARSLTRGDRGVLRIGATPHLIANLFPGFLRKFALKYPHVRLQTVEGGSLDNIEALRRGDLHAAITPLEANEAEFITHPLPPVHLIAAYRHDTFGALGAIIEVRDLIGVPLLLLTQAFGTRTTFDAACRLEKLRPDMFLESSAPETLLALAREGYGVAILPSVAPIDRQGLRLAPLHFRGVQLEINIGVLWNGQYRQPRYAGVLSAVLAEHMHSLALDRSPSVDNLPEKNPA